MTQIDVSSSEIDTGRNSNLPKNMAMNFNNTLGNLSALLSNSSIGGATNNCNDDSVNGAGVTFNNT